MQVMSTPQIQIARRILTTNRRIDMDTEMDTEKVRIGNYEYQKYLPFIGTEDVNLAGTAMNEYCEKILQHLELCDILGLEDVVRFVRMDGFKNSAYTLLSKKLRESRTLVVADSVLEEQKHAAFMAENAAGFAVLEKQYERNRNIPGRRPGALEDGEPLPSWGRDRDWDH